MSEGMVELAEGIVVAPEPDRYEFLQKRARGFGKGGSKRDYYEFLRKPVRTVPPAPAWMLKPLKPPGR